MLENRGLTFYAIVAVGGWILYYVALGVYRAYFGPLAKIPGPRLYAASPFPWMNIWIRGLAVKRIEELHRQYGPVVRFAPEDVSFTTAQAWQDILSHQRSRIFVKAKKNYSSPPEGVDSILTDLDPDSHARQKRLLSHAFSERALKEQEPLMQKYVDLLIERLQSKAGETVNIVQWYNYITFDVIGDLAFGDPFNCLKEDNLHPWVAMIFEGIQAISIFSIFSRFQTLHKLLLYLIPRELVKRRNEHSQLGRDKMERRLAEKTDRKDFFSYILRHKDERSMGNEEMAQNSTLFIIAGSETTATLLSGATYLLLKNRDKLECLEKEVLNSFKSESEIDMLSTGKLKYLHAVLEEALRLYPPIPVMSPRQATQDTIVDGHVIPKGTIVGVSHFAAYRSPANFHDPEAFKPERWIDPNCKDSKAVHNPFSMGPRNCIGRNLAYAEMRMILCRMVWNFEMTLENDNWDIRKQQVHLLWQKPALMLKLKKR